MADIDKTAEVVKQLLDDDRPRDDLYAEIDNAVDCVFEPDEEMKKLPWIGDRHYGMTNIADGRNAAARTFSTLLPKIEISPLSEEANEYQRTENGEQVWEWEFKRMNRVQSKKGIHDRLVEMAVTYHSVAMQTEYLPFKFKNIEKDGRIKAMLANKSMNWSLHHPGSVHSQSSDYGMERVAKVMTISAQKLIDNFGEDNKGVVALKKKMGKSDPVDFMTTEFTLIDYMDWKDRVIWAVEGNSTPAKSDIVFKNEEHGLPFLPWIVIDYGDPLWKSIIQSGIWHNIQHINMILFAKAIEQSTRSTIIVKTPDGTLHNVWIDFSNPSNPIVAPLDGTTVDNLQPAPLDPQLSTQFQQMMNMVSSSTVSNVLTNIGQFSDAPFSTVDKIVQMALGQLSPAKKTAEAAESLGIYQGFQWIEHSKIPMYGFRGETTDKAGGGEEPNKRGSELTIWPGKAPTQKEIEKMKPEALGALSKRMYFDLEHLYVNVNLQSANTADEQARMNTTINAVDKLGMSRRNAFERLNYKNFDQNQMQRAAEDLFEAMKQAEAQKLIAAAEMEVQQAQMQMQQQAMQQQQSQEAQAAEQNAGGTFASAEGVDPRGGGAPPTRPGMGREQINNAGRATP